MLGCILMAESWRLIGCQVRVRDGSLDCEHVRLGRTVQTYVLLDSDEGIYKGSGAQGTKFRPAFCDLSGASRQSQSGTYLDLLCSVPQSKSADGKERRSSAHRMQVAAGKQWNPGSVRAGNEMKINEWPVAATAAELVHEAEQRQQTTICLRQAAENGLPA